jgi:deoxyhypusine synthase
VNTGHEFEASDSGAKPTEALSWGKIRLDAEYVKLYSEVSLALPLLVAGSFKKHEKSARRVEEWFEWKKKNRD